MKESGSLPLARSPSGLPAHAGTDSCSSACRRGSVPRNPSPVTSARKSIQCAVYTRKSTEEGLEQPFNSLDAQREAAEAYIASQRHQGWTLLPERFDDGGY